MVRLPRFVVLGLCLGLARDARAEERVPAANQAVILARAIAYDRNLASRAQGRLTVIVLQGPTNASASVAADMGTAFVGLSSVSIGGLPLDTYTVTWTDAAALGATIDRYQADAIYITPDLEGSLDAIVGVCRAKQVLSLASTRDYLSSASLGVFRSGSEPRLVVNVAASKAEGAAFGAELLRLAEVIQ